MTRTTVDTQIEPADELAALALFQDQGRRDWKREAEEQQGRADAAEARLAEAEKKIVELRSRLRQEIVGGTFAGDRAANAWNKGSGG